VRILEQPENVRNVEGRHKWRQPFVKLVLNLGPRSYSSAIQIFFSLHAGETSSWFHSESTLALAVMTSLGDSPTTYQQDLIGRIEYRSAKPIKAYEKWSIASVDTVIKSIETIIRASPDLAQFCQSVRDGSHETYLYPPLVSTHFVRLAGLRSNPQYFIASHISYDRGCSSRNDRI